MGVVPARRRGSQRLPGLLERLPDHAAARPHTPSTWLCRGARHSLAVRRRLAEPPNTPARQARAWRAICLIRNLRRPGGRPTPFPGPRPLEGYTHQHPPRGEQHMTQRPPSTWDTKPHKPIFYSPAARLADRFAGRGDGNAAIPDLPAGPVDIIDAQAATTPYLEIRRRHFLDRSEHEHRHMLNDLEPVRRQLAALPQDIAGGEEKVTEIRKRLAAIPEKPDEATLNSRNAVEQHIDQALARAR